MKTQRVVALVSAETMGDMTVLAGRLTKAEGTKRGVPDVVRNAVAFYEQSVARCLPCQSGTPCAAHGTAALQPEPPKPPSDVNHSERAAVLKCYRDSFNEARGEPPSVSAREAKAAGDLLTRAGSLDAALRVIRAAFASPYWRSKATLLSIAADPSRHLGATDARQPQLIRSSLQADSGYEGGEEQ
jgi:hypothetical protein